jgi:hypothetical protein
VVRLEHFLLFITKNSLSREGSVPQNPEESQMNRRTARLLTITALLFICTVPGAQGAGLIIDHTCCDIDQVPPACPPARP